MERGRFAPTPSGPLHAGSARTALASALAAWSRRGRFVLRVEDLDALRTPAGALQRMLDDLRWLGLEWDEGPCVGGPHEPYLQSQRQDRYAEALDALERDGRVYPCACSRQDIERAAQAPHGREPVYPGTCRGRPRAEVERDARARGRGIAWRFRVDTGQAPVTVHDGLRGTHREDVAREVGDFVVRRADGIAAYQLAVVVDDIAMGITEVVRGADLLGSTARQVLLYEALGGRPPRWVHVPLVMGDDGVRLAKRHGGISLEGLRSRGISPSALRRALLSSLGVTDPGDDLRAMAPGFDVARIPGQPLRWSTLLEEVDPAWARGG